MQAACKNHLKHSSGSASGGTTGWLQGVEAERRGPSLSTTDRFACHGLRQDARIEVGLSEQWEPLSCKGKLALAPLRLVSRSKAIPLRSGGQEL